MSHELHYDDMSDCLILRFEGTVTMERIRKVAPQVARVCAETGCYRLLNDMRATTINISVTELFTNPKAMDESGISRTIKRALVVPSAFDMHKFLETITRKSGHNLKVFKDIETAKQWLLAEQ